MDLNGKPNAIMEDNLSDVTNVEIEVASSKYNIPSSKNLIDIANNTFRELCQTLENEQNKLNELEERRKKLQEDMLRLKKEIEDEKNAYSLDLEEYNNSYPDLQFNKSLESASTDQFSDANESVCDENVVGTSAKDKQESLKDELKNIMKNITKDNDMMMDHKSQS